MLTGKNGLKMVAVVVVAWGLSSWVLDRQASLENGSARGAADQAAEAGVAPPSEAATASPPPMPQPLVEAAHGARQAVPMDVSSMPAGVNMQVMVAALEAATTTLKMAAMTLQLAVERHAEVVAMTQRQAPPQSQPGAVRVAAPKPPTAPAGVDASDSNARLSGSGEGAAILLAEVDTAQYHLAQGRQALWQGKDREALAYFRKAAALAPQNSAVQGEFGNLLYRLGHWPEAVGQFFTVSELHLAAGEYQRVIEMLPLFRQLAPAKAVELRKRLRQAQQRQWQKRPQG